MEQTEELILEPLLLDAKVKRINLLPWWMTACCWLFLFSFVFVVIAVIMSLFDLPITLSFYGLEATTVYSPFGALITIILLLKAVVAYGLWWEKDWAINLGIVDAIAGIGLCTIIMILPFLGTIPGLQTTYTLRLELFLLIPYLLKLLKMQPLWVKEQH